MTSALHALAPRSNAEDGPRSLVRLGMPHLDPGGLSENWLFRHAGDLHWQAITERIAAASDQIRGEAGQRLYATFVAVRARYEVPLARVRENDLLESRARVIPCGRTCAIGRVVARVGHHQLSLEMLSTFAQREPGGSLRMAVPAARLATRWMTAPADPEPVLAGLARAARRGEPVNDAFSGPMMSLANVPLGDYIYQPSPYADYNGAGLLYFASYVTIADTAERIIVRRLGLDARARGDWALATSTVRRDVFYYGNLALGDAIVGQLIACGETSGGVQTRLRLQRERDRQTIADIVTLKRWVQAPT